MAFKSQSISKGTLHGANYLVVGVENYTAKLASAARKRQGTKRFIRVHDYYCKSYMYK